MKFGLLFHATLLAVSVALIFGTRRVANLHPEQRFFADFFLRLGLAMHFLVWERIASTIMEPGWPLTLVQSLFLFSGVYWLVDLTRFMIRSKRAKRA